jgi:hypothetical protein
MERGLISKRLINALKPPCEARRIVRFSAFNRIWTEDSTNTHVGQRFLFVRRVLVKEAMAFTQNSACFLEINYCSWILMFSSCHKRGQTR